MNVVTNTAHIDLTLEQWKACDMPYRYDGIVKDAVQTQLGWDGPFKTHSEFHYLNNNMGVRLTVTYQYLEPA